MNQIYNNTKTRMQLGLPIAPANRLDIASANPGACRWVTPEELKEFVKERSEPAQSPYHNDLYELEQRYEELQQARWIFIPGWALFVTGFALGALGAWGLWHVSW